MYKDFANIIADVINRYVKETDDKDLRVSVNPETWNGLRSLPMSVECLSFNASHRVIYLAGMPVVKRDDQGKRAILINSREETVQSW